MSPLKKGAQILQLSNVLVELGLWQYYEVIYCPETSTGWVLSNNEGIEDVTVYTLSDGVYHEPKECDENSAIKT